MKNLFELLKATVVGGIVFLIPLVVTGMVLAKARKVMRLLTQPFEAADSSTGLFLSNLLALTMVLLVCLLAGLVAKSALGKRVGKRLESRLFSLLPGYGFVKGFTDSMSESDSAAQTFQPVLARFDDSAQIAFEVERTAAGSVVIYLPGAPNPWSGSVVYMSADRIEPLELNMREAVKKIRQLGRGTAAIGS